jgi:ABC-type transporter Mla maintaining outer membrane lipid asymmetry ATPase subunit MlaF
LEVATSQGGSGQAAVTRGGLRPSATGVVGELAARLADQPEHRLAGVTHDLADAVQEHKAQALGAGVVQRLGQGDPLESREQVVEQHVEAEPGGVGAEPLARQGLGRQLVPLRERSLGR